VSLDPIGEYLQSLAGRLRGWPWKRRRVLAEVEDHLRESAEVAEAAGADRAEAQRSAVERFGDTAALGSPRQGWSVPRVVVAAGLAVAAVVAAVVVVVERSSPSPRQHASAIKLVMRVAGVPVAARFKMSQLAGVVVVSARDGWAIGSASRGLRYPISKTFIGIAPVWPSHLVIYHWDGSRWHPFPAPNVPGTWFTQLSASSPTNVWASGGPGYDGGQGHLAHFTGQRWQLVHVPIPPKGGGHIFVSGVSPISSRLAFAVGAADPFYIHPAALRWNGRRWSIMRVPNGPDTDGTLDGVAALSASDVWAVGESYYHGPWQPLIEHFNGHTWSIVSSPPISGRAGLSSIAAISPTNIWAAGYWQNGHHGVALVEHYNGHTWTRISVPPAGTQTNVRSLTAARDGQLWLVGLRQTRTASYEPFAEQYTGQSWKLLALPTPAHGWSTLLSASALPTGGAIAVGYGSPRGWIYQPLVEQITTS